VTREGEGTNKTTSSARQTSATIRLKEQHDRDTHPNLTKASASTGQATTEDGLAEFTAKRKQRGKDKDDWEKGN
jgi:hypothetical protein